MSKAFNEQRLFFASPRKYTFLRNPACHILPISKGDKSLIRTRDLNSIPISQRNALRLLAFSLAEPLSGFLSNALLQLVRCGKVNAMNTAIEITQKPEFYLDEVRSMRPDMLQAAVWNVLSRLEIIAQGKHIERL